MLEGTDLSSAYSSIINQEQDQGGFGAGSGYSSSYEDVREREVEVPKQKPKQQDNAITQQLAAIQTIANAQYQKSSPPVQKAQQQQAQAPQYDMSVFNKQFEQDQRINTLVNELKKQKQQQQQVAAYQQQQPMYYDESYWDKMANKKKDIFKFIQSGLIILFAISLHVVIDFVLKHYLQTHDISYNREVMIRFLYPIGILFIAWNIIAFIK